MLQCVDGPDPVLRIRSPADGHVGRFHVVAVTLVLLWRRALTSGAAGPRLSTSPAALRVPLDTAAAVAWGRGAPRRAL